VAAASFTGFLFRPANVEALLADLPEIAAVVPPPSAEGKTSAAFPAARRSRRELYRSRRRLCPQRFIVRGMPRRLLEAPVGFVRS